jgi:hypothetical protein
MPRPLYPRVPHWIGDRVDPGAGLNRMERRKILPLPGLELRPVWRPARSQSLWRLSYPGVPDVCLKHYVAFRHSLTIFRMFSNSIHESRESVYSGVYYSEVQTEVNMDAARGSSALTGPMMPRATD